MLRRSASLTLALLLAGPAFGDDLAALARKEKERRARLAKPGRSYTESDVKGEGGGAVTSLSPATNTPSNPPAAAPAGPSMEEQKASWKAKADAIRAELENATGQLVVMKREYGDYDSDMAPLSSQEIQDPMRRQKREGRKAEMRAQIEKQTLIVANIEKSIGVLETEARKSGIPPGWLR